MLRKLLMTTLSVVTLSAHAQRVGITPVKTTEKQDDSQIDYKQVGAPMPQLLLTIVQDTATNSSGDKLIQKHRTRKADENGSKPAAKVTPRKAVMTNEDFDNGANLFVMMFNPTCAHCEDETKMLGKNIDKFKRSKIILMAKPLMRPYMPDFAKAFHVFEHEPMYLGTDSTNFIDNCFLYQSLPQMNIYGHDRKLLKIYTGEVSIDTLAKYIE